MHSHVKMAYKMKTTAKECRHTYQKKVVDRSLYLLVVVADDGDAWMAGAAAFAVVAVVVPAPVGVATIPDDAEVVPDEDAASLSARRQALLV